MKILLIIVIAVVFSSDALAKKSRRTPAQIKAQQLKKKRALKECRRDYRGISGVELEKCIDVRTKPKK